MGALKLKSSIGSGTTAGTEYTLNSQISQTVGAGQTAIGYVASWDPNTGVLRYYQPVGLSTISNNNFRNFDFEGNTNPVNCVGMAGTALFPDTSFTNVSSVTLSGKVIDLGQTFILGKANPEVEKYSGDIIYIDNRAPISRSESQKEEVKVVVEF